MTTSPPPTGPADHEAATPDRPAAAADVLGRAAGLTALASPAVRLALDLLEATDDETLADQLALVRIPAPTGDEAARGRAVRDRLVGLGLAGVSTDAVGNVVARRPGSIGGATVALVAHLDTAFPPGTDVTVRRAGRRYLAPGIADNARGLAALLAVARAVTRAPVRPRADILFVASVGEEGLGNLLGVRHLLDENPAGRGITQLIALDGCDPRRVVRQAVGSRRLRITIRGPGGHSWGAHGTPSALHALGSLITRLAALELRAEPHTTLNVGLAGGGSAINAIAAEAWCLVEIRSLGEETLDRAEAAIRTEAGEALRVEHERTPPPSPWWRSAGERAGLARGGRAALSVTLERLGVRPCGETPADDRLVRAARAATRALGLEPVEPASSTDANEPISRGIPAITLGAGGRGGGAHTCNEWYENEDGARGVQRILLTALEVAGVEP